MRKFGEHSFPVLIVRVNPFRGQFHMISAGYSTNYKITIHPTSGEKLLLDLVEVLMVFLQPIFISFTVQTSISPLNIV